MSRRSSTRIAWALVIVSAALHAGWVWILVLNVRSGLTGDAFAYVGAVTNAVPVVAFVAVGFLVATRKPDNPIGWLLLLTGPISGLPLLATQYAAYALLARHGELPGGRAIAVALNGMWVPSLFVLIMLALLFPTGRPPTRRWRFVVWLAAVSLTLVFLISHMLELDPPFSEIRNPLRYEPRGIVAGALFLCIISGLFASAVAACASVIVRFRRSKGDEREQLKWFVLAASTLPLGLMIHLSAETFAPSAIAAVEAGFSLASSLLPIAIGIAILKYRLYEIDRIISRALVYGGLTVVLGGAYIGLVLAGQALFSSFVGGSNLAIAVSTLAVAALFLPVRSRVQTFVDRRFYRRRYNAQRTLEAFGSRLREQVDLGALSGELRGVVDDTMQPTHVGLWLRDVPR